MSTIKKYIGVNGKIYFRVQIRKNNQYISKNFNNEEDAQIFAFYKERLISNMIDFEIPIEQRVSIKQLFELKMNNSKSLVDKSFQDFSTALKKLSQVMDVDKFLCEYTYQDWLEICKNIYNLPVYRGAEKESCKVSMSIGTLRKIFACISSVFTNAISNNIPVENHAMKVMQYYINPLLKNEKTP